MSTTTIEETAALDAWVRLLRGHAALVRELNAELLRDHGLTINDYEALLLLANAVGKRLRRTDLSRSLALTPSGVTRLLEGLESAGFVARGRDAQSIAFFSWPGMDELYSGVATRIPSA